MDGDPEGQTNVIEEAVEEDEQSSCSSRRQNNKRAKPAMDFERQRECREAFDKTLMKITRVKMFSSPTAKIEYISKFISSIMPDDGLQEADWVVSLMILAFVCMGRKSADMLIEIRYIKSFS
jgi:hypothetical protein